MARRPARTVGMIAAVLLGTIALVGPATAAGASDPAGPSARRVLVFSMPYVSWADLDAAALPNLDRFVRAAGVAGLSTRIDARETPLGDGYATIGAGTRTVSVDDASGGGLMVDEPFGAATAGETYTQRTGRASGDAIVQTAIVGVLGANSSLHYDTEVGALAAALDGAGIGRAVIANGDGEDPDAARSTLDSTPGPARQREAVLGLMDGDGRVPAGRVDPGLLRSDPDASTSATVRPSSKRLAPRGRAGRSHSWRRPTSCGWRATGPTSPRRRTTVSSRPRCAAPTSCSAR